MKITATSLEFDQLNQLVRQTEEQEIEIEGCQGQRFIADGLSDKHITIHGVPGNALGAYLNGAVIDVMGNAQDAVGDTMNHGIIRIHGRCGDAAGYAMRGGAIYIEGDVGYRAGIHMKAYEDRVPVMVIGGCAGSFLGEYQAGGLILVLNRQNKKVPVGYFCGTGMHGGKIFLRTQQLPCDLPKQVIAQQATEQDMEEIMPHLEEYSRQFGAPMEELLEGSYYVLTPDSKNPYKQMYVNC